MKIVFAGSPAFSLPALERLCGCEDVVAVLTARDKPVGRKQALTPTPVKSYALESGIPVMDFPTLKGREGEIASFRTDAMVTCSYGLMIPRSVLDLFPEGVWNLHASLLPKFRGASPIQAAILAGEKYTGVTVMRTEEKLDSGDMLLAKRVEIGDDTCGALSERLSRLAADAAEEAMGFIERGDTQLLVQNEAEATYCKKIKKEDARLDFAAAADAVVRKIKAFSPSPAAYCRLNGKILNVLDARASDIRGDIGRVLKIERDGIYVGCGEGSVVFTRLQLEGAKALDARDFINGKKVALGDALE